MLIFQAGFLLYQQCRKSFNFRIEGVVYWFPFAGPYFDTRSGVISGGVIHIGLSNHLAHAVLDMGASSICMEVRKCSIRFKV
jgi:hypothetical protein